MRTLLRLIAVTSLAFFAAPVIRAESSLISQARCTSDREVRRNERATWNGFTTTICWQSPTISRLFVPIRGTPPS